MRHPLQLLAAAALVISGLLASIFGESDAAYLLGFIAVTAGVVLWNTRYTRD